jgi:hypothetical protein
MANAISKHGRAFGGLRHLSALLGAASLVVLVGGCDDHAPKKPTRGVTAATGTTAGPTAAIRVAETDVRHKTLKDEDFIESPSNRDPFHSFMADLTQSKTHVTADFQVYFDRYACEELKLIAVVTGGLDPRALFRDPSGLGIPLRVGDHMCKAHWRIKRIVNEGVVVELEQDTGGVKPKLVERMLAINPGEEASK